MRFRCLLIAAWLGLLSSCQSSRPAFYFGLRPAPTPPAAAAAADSVAPLAPPALPGLVPQAAAARATAAPAAPQLPAAAQPLLLAPAPAVQEPATKRLAAKQRGRLAPKCLGFRRMAARSARNSRPHFRAHPTLSTDDFFFLGGIALVGLGLAVGLMIGGTPGLLVGLALGIPGYVLIGRGYAGSWNSAARPLRTTTRIAAAHPADGIDALGRFFLKVGLGAALFFLLILALGLILGSTATAIIGAVGLGLLVVLTLALLNS